MVRRLLERLNKMERNLARTASECHRPVLPHWLVEELRAQGIPVSADGMPDLSRVNVDREGNVSREG
jgi:hypothetical protein